MMRDISRRAVIKAGLAGAAAMGALGRGFAQESDSLQELGGAMLSAPPATIFTAREIVTLDPNRPTARALAVSGGRILWVGSLDEVQRIVGEQPHTVDTSFADQVVVPGFIAQHDHPVLAALTMSSEILAIEDWELPGRTVRAVKDKQDFMERLASAEAALSSPDEPLLTWGYHPDFFGPLTGSELDEISANRPIIVWARSCHEMVLNRAAMKRGGVTQEVHNSFAPSAKAQSNFEEARFWEQGLFAVLPYIANMVATPERLKAGLELTRDYMHSNGITIGNEPGGILAKPVQDAVNAVFSSPDMPFRWSFTVDAKTMVAKYADDAQVITETENLSSWYGGMTSLAPKHAKLFADGAIYSLLMQVRDPYLDSHKGEWMMDEDAFNRAFRIYWDAGYQLHIHVNGDRGLDRVLNTLEANLRRNPRYDHRTVLVHFAVSAPDQVERIKTLGAIVSGNPYYVTALADQYSKVGLGPKRAQSMVRLGDVTRSNISWSLHSDMPMAPADPLFLMWCAANRVTASGKVAGPEQRVGADLALRGVTIDAAHSLRLEDEIGSIVPGKRANLTILSANPLAVDPLKIRDVKVWGTVMEGRKLPAGYAAKNRQKKSSLEPNNDGKESEFAHAALDHAVNVATCMPSAGGGWPRVPRRS